MGAEAMGSPSVADVMGALAADLSLIMRKKNGARSEKSSNLCRGNLVLKPSID